MDLSNTNNKPLWIVKYIYMADFSGSQGNQT